VIGIGSSVANLGYNLRDSWWGVPRISGIELPEVAEQFDELREVGLPGENIFDATLVKVKAVSRKLEATIFCKAISQIDQKLIRGFASALTDDE